MIAQAFVASFVLVAVSDAFCPVPSSPGSAVGNSDTRIFSTNTDGGFIKTVSKPGSSGKPVNLGDIATVKYTCYLPGNEKAAPFARSEKQKMVRLTVKKE